MSLVDYQQNTTSNYRLLLVDDSAIDLQLLSNVLGETFISSFARSVDDAISLLNTGFRPDIILLDILMPNKTGYELCEYLQQDPDTANIPVIFVSSLDNMTDKALGFKFGAVDYITKPYEPEELKIRLLKHLSVMSRLKQLESLANIDELTQVPNRRKYESSLANEWQKCASTNETIALFVIDIDHFKGYNDFYGHAEGDKCLKNVANALCRLASRRQDIFARFGGEEFVLVLPDCTAQGAQAKAEEALKIVADLHIPCEFLDANTHLSISVGISMTQPSYGSTPARLFKEADLAMYRAKETGRNRFIVH